MKNPTLTLCPGPTQAQWQAVITDLAQAFPVSRYAAMSERETAVVARCWSSAIPHASAAEVRRLYWRVLSRPRVQAPNLSDFEMAWSELCRHAQKIERMVTERAVAG